MSASTTCLPLARIEPQPNSWEPLSAFRTAFQIFFGQNGDQATITFLTYLSAGTAYSLALIVTGPSSSGKTFMTQQLALLFPEKHVQFTSDMSPPGMFAIGKFSVLVSDEFKPDPDFDRIRRQLISTGRVARDLATPSGEPRHDEITGNIAFVETTLEEQHIEFQNGNRVIMIAMSVDPDQILRNAQMTARAYTRAGADFVWWWENLRKVMVRAWDTLDLSLQVVFPDWVVDLVPPNGGSQLARRVDQVLKLASMIALWRQHWRIVEDTYLKGTAEDVRSALELLCSSSPPEDEQHLDGRSRAFLRAFAVGLGVIDDQGRVLHGVVGEKSATVGHIVKYLNEPCLAQMMGSVVDESKRRHRRGGLMVTRRIVDRHLKILFDCGLAICKRVDGEKKWFMTAQGAVFLACDCTSTFAAMLRLLKAKGGE